MTLPLHTPVLVPNPDGSPFRAVGLTTGSLPDGRYTVQIGPNEFTVTSEVEQILTYVPTISLNYLDIQNNPAMLHWSARIEAAIYPDPALPSHRYLRDLEYAMLPTTPPPAPAKPAQRIPGAWDTALLIGMVFALLLGPVLDKWQYALFIGCITLSLAILLYLWYGSPTDNKKEPE